MGTAGAEPTDYRRELFSVMPASWIRLGWFRALAAAGECAPFEGKTGVMLCPAGLGLGFDGAVAQ
jgi:hypothetical protein